MFVHTYNGMRGLHQREPGVLGCAMTTDETYAELICDGQALDCYEDKRCAKGTQAIYDLLRSKVPEMDNDMPLTPYLEAVAQQIIDRAYIRTVEVSVGALKF